MEQVKSWNTDYEKDVDNNIKWYRRIMKVLGLWALLSPTATKTEKIFFAFLVIVSLSCMGFVLICLFLYILISEELMADKVKVIGPVGYILMSIFKYLCLVFRCKEIRHCAEIMNIDWQEVNGESYRNVMIRYTKMCHLLSKVSIYFIYCGGMCYNVVMPFVVQGASNENNKTIHPIPYPGCDIIFDMNFMSTYVIIYSIQCLCGIITFNITVAVCSLAAMLVTHACGQMQIVTFSLKDMITGTKLRPVDFNSRISKIIKHHVNILRFSARIEEVLREVCFVEFIGSTLIMCFVEYYCIVVKINLFKPVLFIFRTQYLLKKEWRDKNIIAILTYILLLTSFVFNIFMYCYMGELLIEQCKMVGYTCYDIEWYQIPGKSALHFKLIIITSNNPIKITAGKIINLSIVSFGNVIKASLTYLNLIRTVIT